MDRRWNPEKIEEQSSLLAAEYSSSSGAAAAGLDVRDLPQHS